MVSVTFVFGLVYWVGFFSGISPTLYLAYVIPSEQWQKIVYSLIDNISISGLKNFVMTHLLTFIMCMFAITVMMIMGSIHESFRLIEIGQMPIPWILHQTYKTKDLRKEWIQYRNSWHLYGDNWDYRFYLDEDLRNHIQKYFPQYLTSYDSFVHFIERVDFARYAILHTFGGVYADLDMMKYKSFHPIMQNSKTVLSSEPIEHSVTVYKRQFVLSNALMLSDANNPYWLSLMDYIVKNYDPKKKPIRNTGPMALTLHWEEAYHHRGGFANLPNNNLILLSEYVTLYPCCIFFSETWSNQVSKPCVGLEAYAVHKWSTSWVGTPDLIRAGKWCKENGMWIILLFVTVIVFILVAILVVLIVKRQKKLRIKAMEYYPDKGKVE